MERRKIVLAGNSGVGKTSIIHAEIGSAKPTSPTIGAEATERDYEYNGKTIRLQFWDTAGGDNYKNIVPIYFQRANAIIFVFDLTDERSINDLESWCDVARKNAPEDCVYLLVGNKMDLGARPVSEDEILSIQFKIHALEYYKTSAVTKEGINEFINYLISANISCDKDFLPELTPEEKKKAIQDGQVNYGCPC